jgi:hypothetical protein
MRLFILASLALSLLLASCQTLKIADGLPIGNPKGYVSFYSVDLNLSIAKVEGGSELPAARNWDFFNNYSDYRVACPVGTSVFVVRHGNYAQSFKVEVRSDKVSYLSFREQILSSSSSTTYMGTVGSHALPADPEDTDPAPFLSALEDGDWGTRRAALAALRRIRPKLDEVQAALVKRMAYEDAILAVRQEAEKLLKSLGLKVPAPPLFLDAFESNLANHWYMGAGGGKSSFELDAEGYLISATDEISHWATANLPKNIAGLADYDAILECEWKGGQDNKPFGLLLGSDWKNFHAFCVSKNGGAMAARFKDSNDVAADFGWTQEASASIAADPVIRISVAKRGASYSMKVDGVSVGSFTDDSPLPVASVGMIIWGAQDIVFRKVLIKSPE